MGKIAIWLTSLLLMSSFEAFAEKTRLNDQQLKSLIDDYYIASGISTGGWAFMVVNESGGKRTMYLDNFATESRVWKGKVVIKNGKPCTTYDKRPAEHCYDIYDMGNGKREAWRDGIHVNTHMVMKAWR